jgi:hypothetical protein
MKEVRKPTTITKTVKVEPTSSPGEPLKVKLAKDVGLKYVRVFVGNSGEEKPLEIVFHEPIGVTDLAHDDWVRSEYTDVALMLTRRKSPNEQVLIVKRIEHKKELAVDKKLIQIGPNKAVLYPTKDVNRNDFLKPHRDAAKVIVKNSNLAILNWKNQDEKARTGPCPKKLSENEALIGILRALPDDNSAKEELAYSAFMSDKATVEAAEKEFPDDYKTMKGPNADIPQVAVAWAKGLSQQQIQHEVGKYLYVLTGNQLGSLGPAVASAFSITEVVNALAPPSAQP